MEKGRRTRGGGEVVGEKRRKIIGGEEVG